MSEDTIGVIWMVAITVVVTPIAIVLYVRDRQRIRDTVAGWAAANQVVLVRRLPTWYRLSPFVLTALLGGHQKIEYWVVRDSVGIERRVWFKLGSYLRGATRDISAEWES